MAAVLDQVVMNVSKEATEDVEEIRAGMKEGARSILSRWVEMIHDRAIPIDRAIETTETEIETGMQEKRRRRSDQSRED